MDFLPGIAAGTTGCIIGYPFDAVKVRMQTNMYPTNYECVKQIITKEGSNCFSYSYSTLRINKNERKRK